MRISSKRHCERSEAIQIYKWIAASLMLLSMTVLLFARPAIAQDEAATNEAAQEARTDIQLPKDANSEYASRRALAEKMHKFRPVREQVNSAIDQYAQTQPPQQREAFKTTMRNVLNYKALEKISTDAYADTFTLKELESMVEYYSKPEARSASDKFDDYAGLVYPEIIRMLDKALIRVRTGGDQ